MSKSQRLYTTLAAVVLMVGTFAAALIWGIGSGPALAAPDADPLVARKSVSSQEVAPGQTVRYTIVLTNATGTTLGNVQIGDALDPDLTYVTNSHEILPVGTPGFPGAPTNGMITFTLTTMSPGAVVTISFDADLDVAAVPATVIQNLASVYSGTVYVGDTNSADFTVSPAPDLQIYSPDSGAVVTDRPGQVLPVSGRAWAQFDPAPFPDPPILQPIINFLGAGTYDVEWTAVAGADNYVLQESATEGFDAPTSFPIPGTTESKFITGKGAGTYYYRVAAYNADTHPSRWSNVQVVTVTSTSLTSATSGDIASASMGELNLAAAATITVEVSVDDGGTWHPASLTADPDGWWDWSYNWTLPEADGVKYPIMARAAYVTGGEYSHDTITVTLDNSGSIIFMPIIFKRWPPIPYAPTLNDITPSGSNFTVSWTYTSGSPNVPLPTDYQLQQASDAAFTQNVVAYTVGGLSKTFTDMPGGSYYYRVRGRNGYGYGEWSNTKSVLLGRAYEFTNSVEGWVVRRSDEDDGYWDTPQSVWNDGKLYHLIWGSADSSVLSPMETGPTVPYTIKARVDIVDSETINGKLYQAKSGMTWGIIFGGNSGTPCPALRTSGGCLSHYYRVLITWDQAGESFKWSLKRIDYHDDTGTGDGKELVGWTEISGFDYDDRGWNEWQIEVTNAATNNITVSMNNRVLAQRTDHTYINDRYFGTFASSLRELGAVATKWDWFRIQ